MWKIASILILTANLCAAAERPRIGMVSDGGRFDDAGFNQLCKEGLERAMGEYKFFAKFFKSEGPQDYRRKLTALAERNLSLIIGIGILIRDDLAEVARMYTNQTFAVVDGDYAPPIPNVRGMVFRVDQCAFPAGYLAAAWAALQDPDDPQVGFVGGMKVETVEQFTVPFAAGVDHYNRRHGKPVKVQGDYAGSFTDEEKGWAMGAAQIKRGVDVIFGVGSRTGNGALRAAREAGKWGIGVDTDQYYSLPEEKDILLTSCLKKLDEAVYDTVRAFIEKRLEVGSSYVGTLANAGVGLAPYHAFENKIPEAIRAEVQALLKGIADGTVKTGWRE